MCPVPVLRFRGGRGEPGGRTGVRCVLCVPGVPAVACPSSRVSPVPVLRFWTGVGELPEPGRALMTERRGPLCVFGRERGVAPRSLLEKCGVNRPGVSTCMKISNGIANVNMSMNILNMKRWTAKKNIV